MDFSPTTLLTPYNYFKWKRKILKLLKGRGLFRITMVTKVEPIRVIKKNRYLNYVDEAYGLISMSISPELLFHIDVCTTPNGIWTLCCNLRLFLAA
jgi:hypothetical protein